MRRIVPFQDLRVRVMMRILPPRYGGEEVGYPVIGLPVTLVSYYPAIPPSCLPGTPHAHTVTTRWLHGGYRWDGDRPWGSRREILLGGEGYSR